MGHCSSCSALGGMGGSLEQVQGHCPARMNAAEQDELGDGQWRVDRLDIVEHRLDALVAGAAKRDQIGLRIVLREAERNDVVHLEVLPAAAHGAEWGSTQGLAADRFPSGPATADARRPAQMALIARPRAETRTGIGAIGQN